LKRLWGTACLRHYDSAARAGDAILCRGAAISALLKYPASIFSGVQAKVRTKQPFSGLGIPPHMIAQDFMGAVDAEPSPV